MLRATTYTTGKCLGERYQVNTLQGFKRDKLKAHPTQKPVELMEYLIKTYTNEGDLILDFTIDSGTTAIATERTGRKWIGIELSEEYCEIAKKRLNKEVRQ